MTVRLKPDATYRESTMPLDIRIPIGAMLGLMGALLTGYGLLGDQTIYERSLGLNINVIWGSVLVVVAAVLVFLGTRGHTRKSER